ncbi:putative cullin protein, neddylation [Plasmopara halstedii]
MAASYISDLKRHVHCIFKESGGIGAITGERQCFLEAVHNYGKIIATICWSFVHLLYLDRTYVMQTPHIASIWDMGLNLMRDNLVQRQSLEKSSLMYYGACEHERKGEAINRVIYVKRMYALFARVNAIDDLKIAFSNYIKIMYKLVMDDQQKRRLWKITQIEGGSRCCFERIVSIEFGLFICYESAMEKAINVGQSSAELVANLRFGRVMVIFRYIQGKDVFEAFYKKDLAKRLLVGKSASFDLEKLMLSKLKTECGSSFTNKASIGTLQVNHGVQTCKLGLTTGFWPHTLLLKLICHLRLFHLKKCLISFTHQVQGRQLQWQHSLAQCVVREIREQARIEDGELRRTLQSLGVLHKSAHPYQNQFNPDEETKKENEDTHERVFRDRQYQVDAAIVRIMKARKKLSHALLMAEIFTQIRFPAKAADIKRRIESLIDREYLERDSTNAQMYNYLA